MAEPPIIRRASSQLQARSRGERKPFSLIRLMKEGCGGDESEADGRPVLERTATMVQRQKVMTQADKELQYFVERSADVILGEFGVTREQGLSSHEAASRLTLHGRNELEKEPPRSFLMLLLDQFSDLLVILLIVSSIVSGALGQYAACVVIILIVLANATLGVIQESRAGEQLDALSALAAPQATVRRDGRILQVESATLVPGDIVILELGVTIPADLRLIKTQDMTAAEMALTGESEPSKKNADYVASDDEDRKGDEKELTEKNMVYMGCAVQEGHGEGMVVKTGMSTKMGEIQKLLSEAEGGDSPLQAKLHSLAVKLGFASIGISLVVFIIGVAAERGTDPQSDEPVWLQMMLVAVSLTVAAVPEGLPACVTITLAIGMAEMVKKNVLIRQLHSVETLGSASVICTDKTGTLTAGKMTAKVMWFAGDHFNISGAGYDPHGTIAGPGAAEDPTEGAHTLPLWVACMCSNASVQFNEETKLWEGLGNSSERPLVVAGMKANILSDDVFKRYPKTHENAFNSARKMMSTLHDTANTKNRHKLFPDSRWIGAIKGAPNVVLSKCSHWVTKGADGNHSVEPITDEVKEAILQQIDSFSEKAYRVLVSAYKAWPGQDEEPKHTPEELEDAGLVFAGMFASIDPERPEVTDSIRKARNAGIRTVMITGDYVKTAKAIAENIGLLPRGSPDSKAVDCQVVREKGTRLENLENAIAEAKKSHDERTVKSLEGEKKVIEDTLDRITAHADVYARAKPVDKITIVRSLQRQGEICSMTGDGVNDAPALKQANIGVAMGITGTDVAKAAADMVLTDDNFCSIVEAVEQGRTIYANIQKFVFFLLSTNVSEVFVILIATAFIGLQSPLSAIQILWLNLATDGAPAVALAVEAIEPGVMHEGPRSKYEPIIEKVMISGIIIQTFVLTSVVLSTYLVGLHWNVGSWDGINSSLTDDELKDGIKAAQTMTILEITFAELLRAYTCRSMRHSILSMGIFTNDWMQYAVGASVVGTLMVTNVPGIMDIFGTVHLGGREWAWVLCMALLPVTVDEITKFFYRQTGFGFRPKMHQTPADTGAVMVKRSKSKGNFDKLDEEKYDVV